MPKITRNKPGSRLKEIMDLSPSVYVDLGSKPLELTDEPSPAYINNVQSIVQTVGPNRLEFLINVWITKSSQLLQRKSVND